MYSFFVDWAQWYYSPIFLAAGVVVVSLAYARGRRTIAAWTAMGLAVAHALVFGRLPVPEELPNWMTQGLWRYVVHPVYPDAVFVSVCLLLAALIVHRRWLVGVAMAPSVSIGLVEVTETVQGSREGRVMGMLVGAFCLLGVGAAMQRWAEQRRRSADQPTDEPGQNGSARYPSQEAESSRTTVNGDADGPTLSFGSPETS
jgi:hypothetical protein